MPILIFPPARTNNLPPPRAHDRTPLPPGFTQPPDRRTNSPACDSQACTPSRQRSPPSHTLRTQPAPQHLQQDVDKVRDFVARQAQEGRQRRSSYRESKPAPSSIGLAWTPDPSDAERRHHRALGAQCVSALQLTAVPHPPGAHNAARLVSASSTNLFSAGVFNPKNSNRRNLIYGDGAGTRGATSAEYFLKAGYAVIFMHRQFSLQPFRPALLATRRTHSSTSSISTRPRRQARSRASPSPPSKRADLLEVLTAYKEGTHARGRCTPSRS